MKSKYETHVMPKLTLIEAWARNGVTEEQIAKNLGVAYSTFKTYKGKHPAISATLARGKEIVDVEVENALHKRALGYNAKVVKHYKLKSVEYDLDTGKRLREVEKLVEAHDEAAAEANTVYVTTRV